VRDTGSLPTILTQHLFTSFMWTVVEYLPDDCLRQNFAKNSREVDIVGRHTFDPLEFKETWARPTLRHRTLADLVSKMEKLGLGLYSDIMLCMIPALSSKDLLPNHTILQLFPPICYPQGWAATAQCYKNLLGTSIRTNPPEMLCYSIVVATMDFLNFACEPYDDFVGPHTALKRQIQTLVEVLLSHRFSNVLRDLTPLYTIQRRRELFENIFGQYASSELSRPFHNGKSRVLSERSAEGQLSTGLPRTNFYMTKLGLSRRFMGLYAALEYESADPPEDVPLELKEKLQQSLKQMNLGRCSTFPALP
jgi:hypothetical protein